MTKWNESGGLTRTLLTVVAVAAATLAAADPFGLPPWVQVVAVAISAGFAAVGIVPPQMVNVTHGDDEVPNLYIRFRDIMPKDDD